MEHSRIEDQTVSSKFSNFKVEINPVGFLWHLAPPTGKEETPKLGWDSRAHQLDVEAAGRDRTQAFDDEEA